MFQKLSTYIGKNIQHLLQNKTEVRNEEELRLSNTIIGLRLAPLLLHLHKRTLPSFF